MQSFCFQFYLLSLIVVVISCTIPRNVHIYDCRLMPVAGAHGGLMLLAWSIAMLTKSFTPFIVVFACVLTKGLCSSGVVLVHNLVVLAGVHICTLQNPFFLATAFSHPSSGATRGHIPLVRDSHTPGCGSAETAGSSKEHRQ